MITLFETASPDHPVAPLPKQAVDRFYRTVVGTSKPGGMIRMPTGTGKTWSPAIIVVAHRRHPLPSSRLCHERQLVQQFAAELEELTGRYVAIDMAEQIADRQARLRSLAARCILRARSTATL